MVPRRELHTEPVGRMMYCEKCRVLFDGKACTVCGKDKWAREVRDGDYVFLEQVDQPWNGTLRDVFDQEGIDYTSVPANKGVVLLGTVMASERFYVRHTDLETARELLSQLLP